MYTILARQIWMVDLNGRLEWGIWTMNGPNYLLKKDIEGVFSRIILFDCWHNCPVSLLARSYQRIICSRTDWIFSRRTGFEWSWTGFQVFRNFDDRFWAFRWWRFETTSSLNGFFQIVCSWSATMIQRWRKWALRWLKYIYYAKILRKWSNLANFSIWWLGILFGTSTFDRIPF